MLERMTLPNVPVRAFLDIDSINIFISSDIDSSDAAFTVSPASESSLIVWLNVGKISSKLKIALKLF